MSLTCADRPGVSLELAQEVSERHVALVHGLQELVGRGLGLRSAKAGSARLLLALSRHGPAPPEPQHLLDLLGSVVLGAAEYVGPGDALAAKLVNLNHLAVGDEADQGIGREQGERHLETLLEGLELILIHASVHNEKEDWGNILQ